MRRLPVAITGCSLLLLSVAARAAPAVAPPIDFEDTRLAKADREMIGSAVKLVSRWAMIQRIVQAVKAQEESPLPSERVEAIDAAWQRGEDPEGLATALARNECSQALQTLISANPGYGEAFVTDDRGGLVCMTQRTSDYFQGDEPSWSRAFAGGAGAVFVSRTVSDASTGLDMMHISVPIRSAGKVVGVLIVGRIAVAPP